MNYRTSLYLSMPETRSAQKRCFRRDDIPITAEAVIGSGVIETLAR